MCVCVSIEGGGFFVSLAHAHSSNRLLLLQWLIRARCVLFVQQFFRPRFMILFYHQPRYNNNNNKQATTMALRQLIMVFFARTLKKMSEFSSCGIFYALARWKKLDFFASVQLIQPFESFMKVKLTGTNRQVNLSKWKSKEKFSPKKQLCCKKNCPFQKQTESFVFILCLVCVFFSLLSSERKKTRALLIQLRKIDYRFGGKKAREKK